MTAEKDRAERLFNEALVIQKAARTREELEDARLNLLDARDLLMEHSKEFSKTIVGRIRSHKIQEAIYKKGYTEMRAEAQVKANKKIHSLDFTFTDIGMPADVCKRSRFDINRV